MILSLLSFLAADLTPWLTFDSHANALLCSIISKFLGILLTATAVDANDSLFPLAFAVVDAENNVNWSWFMDHLHEVVEQNAPAHLIPHFLTFLSNCQKGLLETVQYSFLNSSHAYCIRHLYANFHKRFKNPLLKQ